MVTVDDYGAIRRARRDGMSIRQIARQFGHSRRTVRHALTHADPHPEPLTRDRPAPKLGPFQALIGQILVDDRTAPPKQRHTAAQIYRRLRDESGYHGGYAQVQRYLRKHRRRQEETFIPLGLWVICRAGASRPTSGTSMSTSPTAASPCRSW